MSRNEGDRDVSFDKNAGESAGTLGQAVHGEDGIPEGEAAGTGGIVSGPNDGVNDLATTTAAGVDLGGAGRQKPDNASTM